MSQIIVDAHQHMWNLDRVAYPWLTPDFGVLCRTYEAPELEPLLAPAGVTHTVLVQAANSYADTEYMLEQAARTLDGRRGRLSRCSCQVWQDARRGGSEIHCFGACAI
jgi:predicted TIM-barrel fold metal-dependent hydrolase